MNRNLLLSGSFLAIATLAAAQQPPIPQLPPAPVMPTPAPNASPAAGKAEAATPPAKKAPMELPDYYQVIRIPKKGAIVLGKNRIKPNRVFDVVFELVGEDGDDYLVRNLPPDDPQSAGYHGYLAGSAVGMQMKRVEANLEGRLLLVNRPDVVPPFTDKLEFVPERQGLPDQGRWQMSFDVADMNGDGRPDLVFGPMRSGDPHPWIFLQQPDHSWALWDGLRWPTPDSAKLDYGAVRVADFDGDGNLDIAIACHLARSYVLYGNGKGDFSRAVLLPSENPAASSRSLAVADFNNDGRPDLATMAELDVQIGSAQYIRSGLVNVFLNGAQGWTSVSDGFPTEIQGDDIAAADLDGDGWTDLMLTSRKLGIDTLVWRNLGGGTHWEAVGQKRLPADAFILSTAAGKLGGSAAKGNDLIYCFEEFDPWKKQDKPTQGCAIYDWKTLTSTDLEPRILTMHPEEYENYQRVATGDLDGDGRTDLAVVTNYGRAVVFLQGPDGTFYEEKSPELTFGGSDLMDAKLADLDGDGRAELIVIGAPEGQGKGGIWVFSPRLKSYEK